MPPQSDHDIQTFLAAANNAALWTEQLDNGVHSKVRVQVEVNSHVAPDGTTTADKLKESTTPLDHYSTQNVTLTASTNYVLSIFLQELERNWVVLYTRNKDGTTRRTWFDLNAITVGTNAEGHTGAAIVSAGGSNWRRLIVVFASGTGATQPFIGVKLADADGSDSYNGVASTGVAWWGMHHFAGTEFQPYIKSEGSAGSRSDTFTDITTTAWQTDRRLTPALITFQHLLERIYIGAKTQFSAIHVTSATPTSGFGVLSAEYYNGTAWVSLTVTDGTALNGDSISQDGRIDFEIPSDWAKQGDASLDADKFYVRLFTTVAFQAGQPIVDQISAAVPSPSPRNTTLISDLLPCASAGRFANPEIEAACLPVVYGDLTDGSVGIWEAPQIDTTAGAKVYAFAGHAVLSVADGNSVTVYDDDGEIASGEWTFDESDDFEGKGIIATLTFTTDPNGKVRVQGKGKNSGSSLIENPISIIEDILVNIMGLGASSDVFVATALEDARAYAELAAYKAAGVIERDITPGDLVQQIVANFFGSFHLRPGFPGEEGRKVFIRLEKDPAVSGAISETMTAFIVARERGNASLGPRRRDEIINRAAGKYRFNYFDKDFVGFDDGTTKEDAKSVGIHGALGRRDGPFGMDWIRQLATLQTVQALIVSLLKNAPRVFTVEVIEKAERLLGQEDGDHVSLSLDFVQDPDDGAALANQICRVLSKSYDSAARSLSVRLLDTGSFLTDSAGNRDKVLRG